MTEIFTTFNMVLFGINFIFIVLYVVNNLFSKISIKPSSKNITPVDALVKIAQNEEMDFSFELAKYSNFIEINSTEKTLLIDSKQAHLPITNNIVEMVIKIVQLNSRWLKNEDKIKLFIHIGIYFLYILTATIFLSTFENYINAFSVILVILTSLIFIDLRVRQDSTRKLQKIISDNDLLDQYEIKFANKIIQKWTTSNLDYFFWPLFDIVRIVYNPGK